MYKIQFKNNNCKLICDQEIFQQCANNVMNIKI